MFLVVHHTSNSQLKERKKDDEGELTLSKDGALGNSVMNKLQKMS